MAGVTWGIAHAIGWSNFGEALLASVVGVVAGGAVYLGLLALLRVEELRFLSALLPRRARV